MLSVLIPVYNFDIRLLVNTLHKQLKTANIVFEIICLDDYSEAEIRDCNSEIDQLSYTSYNISNRNQGRVATRQVLAEKASYDWLLFLDADVMPKHEHFIQNYLKYVNDNYQAVYGGFAYNPEIPKDDFILRWTYGKSKEEVASKIRNKTPYKIVISANFLIHKTVFINLNSQIEHKGYGYDNYFGALLKHQNISILHVDNEVFHLGLESNVSYLNKVEQAVDTLLQLEKEGQLQTSENSLLKTYKTLKRWQLNRLCSWIHKTFKKQFKGNILGKSPSIFALQCYKLSYICYQDLNS